MAGEFDSANFILLIPIDFAVDDNDIFEFDSVKYKLINKSKIYVGEVAVSQSLSENSSDI